jgi:ribosome biogenesis GTPase
MFEDVDELAGRRRFSNCGHGREPGCAVRAALLDGSLAPARWRSYVKLRRELEGTRTDVRDRGRRPGMLRKRRHVDEARDRESWGR